VGDQGRKKEGTGEGKEGGLQPSWNPKYFVAGALTETRCLWLRSF